MKHLLLTLCLLAGVFTLKAQDNIYLRKGGTTLEVKIKKVTGNMIYYTAPEGGPQRFIRKDAVERIVYKNGREVVMPDPEKRRAKQPIPSNTITLSLNAIVLGNISGLAAGLDYEHYFGARHLISVHIPVVIGEGTNQETGNDGNPITTVPYAEITSFYAAPGIHYHPINPKKRVDYAVGLSVVIGNLNRTDYYENTWIGGTNVDQQYLLTAITLDNDLNIFSKKKFAFGLHTAVGPVLGDYGKDGKWLVQIGFKLGLRF